MESIVGSQKTGLGRLYDVQKSLLVERMEVSQLLSNVRREIKEEGVMEGAMMTELVEKRRLVRF